MGQRSPDVDAWLNGYDNPLKPLVERAREIVLGADDRIGETIKWSTPTFVYKGNLASFYPKSAKHVSLMFHTGASLPDPYGVLEGDGDTSRVLRVLDHDELDRKADAIRGLVASWISLRG